MDNKLLCSVVMLPINDIGRKKGQLCLTGMGTLLISDNTISPSMYKAQHLYLVSAREIKEGDCYWNSINARAYKNAEAGEYDPIFKKIEATTDPSLGLPLIPSSFIEEYVQKQGKIDKAYIEIYPKGLAEHLGYEYGEPRAVLGEREDQAKNHPDGVVIILPVKDSWNREELREAMWLAHKRGDTESWRSEYDKQKREEFDRWFDKNY